MHNPKIKYVFWQDDEYWLGYIEEFPDYLTQGQSLEELKENLKDLYKDLSQGNVPNIRRAAELELS